MESVKGRRVVVIGLDGATFDVITPLLRDGYLPNVARLIERGAHGPLISTIPPVTGAAWSSFMTGKNPGRHGVYGLMRLQSNSYEVTPISSADRKSRDLWEIAGEQGKRVIVLNVPITYPVRAVNGVLISGFMTPSRAEDYAHPKTILSQIEKQVGEYRISFEDNRRKAERSLWSSSRYEDAFLEDTVKTTRVHAETLFHLMDREEWDFLMIVFQGTDGLQHIFWRDMDPNHPKHDPERPSKYRNVVREFYQLMDEIIGQVVTKLQRESTIFLVSDHGFTPFSKFVSLNVFLMQHGYLKLKREPKILAKRLMFRLGITPLSLFRLLNRLHLGKFRQSLRKEDVRRRIRGWFISLRDVDWSKSVAYSMGGWGQIYLNLGGREPQGIVGEDSKSLTDKIIRGLLALKDPSSGRQVFASGRIYRKEDIYDGPLVSLAPEIVAIPDPPYKTFPDYEFGSNRLITEALGWSGTHAMNGIFVASGPRVIKTSVEPKIIDVAPTILYLLGLPVPGDMDGRVLTEIISQQMLTKEPVRIEHVTHAPVQEEYAMSSTDEEDLRKTLKALGYL